MENEGAMGKNTLEKSIAPWNPTAIATITFVFSILPGSILYRLNFKRLGYTGRIYPSLLTNILTFILIVLLSFFTQIPTGLFLIVNLGYSVYFYNRQESLFKKHIESGGQKGSLLFPFVLSISIMVCLLALAFGYNHFQYNKFEKANLLWDEGKYAEAVQLYREFKKYAPDEPATFYNLATIYYETGKIDLAIGELKEYIRLEQSDKEAKEFLIELQQLNK